MPEKTLTVATYAAGASLAAITLIYVFAPTYFLDNDTSASAGLFGGRRKAAVGLSNPANDCFINAVLQALAGLGDLRLYLIRELHRRNLDDAWIYAQPVPADAFTLSGEKAEQQNAPSGGGEAARKQPPMPAWKVEGLQSGIVTKALKEILDKLNERPIYKKTISAVPFVKSLEEAFRQRISRQQQDAQELLQVVAERVCDEYHAGRKARLYAKATGMVRPATLSQDGEVNGLSAKEPGEGTVNGASDEKAEGKETAEQDIPTVEVSRPLQIPDEEDEDGFPMEGSYESQIECLTCGFKPRPTMSTFCTLTLNVPQMTSTTLNACFDGIFKTEYIDDFKCANCRLVHAVKMLQSELDKSTSPDFRAKTTFGLQKLQHAIATDPEKPPPDVTLPDIRHAPKRKIARHIRMVAFPKILAVHLSRSTWDSSQMSLKNSAKVQFPERLPLGGLLQQRKYKLLGLVTHKGSHSSGHYESFRRQNTYPPFSNPNTFQASGVYSTAPSPAATPQLEAIAQQSGTSSPLASTPDLLTPDGGFNGSTPSLESSVAMRSVRGSVKSSVTAPKQPAPTSAPTEEERDAGSVRSPTGSVRSGAGKPAVSLQRTAQLVNGTGSAPSSESGADVTSSKDSLAVPKPASSTSSSPTHSGGSSGPVPQSQAKAKAPQQQAKPVRIKKQSDTWWRISDEKVKEATTREVLGMQREVYLLFYELER